MLDNHRNIFFQAWQFRCSLKIHADLELPLATPGLFSVDSEQ